MLEKRRLKRNRLSCFLNVHSADNDELMGQVLDIHVEGFLLMNEENLATKRTYTMKIQLPEDIPETDSITFEAESLWSAKKFDPGFYNTGFKIQQTQNETTRAIESLIAAYGR